MLLGWRQQGSVVVGQDCNWMRCCWSEGSKVMLKLVRIAVGCGAAGLSFVEVDAFRADFILVVVTVVLEII